MTIEELKKANEAPEKIYIFENPILDFTKLSVRQSDTDIEYIRTDVFIEKVEEFLNNELYVSISNQICSVDDFTSKKHFIEKFKNYIEKQ